MGLVALPGTPDVRVLFRAAYAPCGRKKRPARPTTTATASPTATTPVRARPARRRRAAVPTPTPTVSPTPRTSARRPPALDGARLPRRDADGVPDAEDLCPGMQRGQKPDPLKKGCPADSDATASPTPPRTCARTPSRAPSPIRRSTAVPPTATRMAPRRRICARATRRARTRSARQGCPQPDADYDGVPDAEDACPRTPARPTPPTRRRTAARS